MGENAGMDVCLTGRRQYLSDDWSTDIRQLFSCSHVVVGEIAENKRKNLTNDCRADIT